jgi:DNA-binding response OmpR family regulator
VITSNLPPTQEANAPPVALIVEDNHLVAETLADGLSALGYASVETVSTVKGALDAVGNENVALAVLETDVRGHSTEPVLDALDASDVAHVVASSDGCNPLPGHAPYLQKPFGFSQLKSAVDQAREQASIRSWNRVH